MKKKMFLTGAAAFIAAGAMAVAPVSAATTDGSQGNTDVTYTNTDAVSPDGVYGLIIPASMAFEASDAHPTMDIELVGVNGYVLGDLSESMLVTLKAKSQNDMDLISGTTKVEYSMEFSKAANAADTTLGKGDTTTDAKEVAKLSPKAGENKTTATGTLVKPGDATVKGTYSDIITFSFTDNGTILK